MPIKAVCLALLVAGRASVTNLESFSTVPSSNPSTRTTLSKALNVLAPFTLRPHTDHVVQIEVAHCVLDWP